MSSFRERLYYRLQGLQISSRRKQILKQLDLPQDAGYRFDLLETLHPIKARVPISDVFVDIGANRGEFSQIFSAIYHPELIICVEPNAGLNHLIKSNNEKSHVVIVNQAISDQQGEADFYFHPDPQMSSLFPSDGELMSRDFKENNASMIAKSNVPITTLDLIFDQFQNKLINKTVFLKIDTQGNELEVIRGGPRSLAQVQYCLLEYMFQSPYKKQYPFEEIVRLMSSNGFNCLGPMHTSYRSTGEVGAVLFLFEKAKVKP